MLEIVGNRQEFVENSWKNRRIMKNHEKQLENFIYYILSRIDLQIHYQNSIIKILLELNFGYIIRIQFLDILLATNYGYITRENLERNREGNMELERISIMMYSLFNYVIQRL